MTHRKQHGNIAVARSVFIQSEEDDFFLHHPNVVLLGFLAVVAAIVAASIGLLWIGEKLL